MFRVRGFAGSKHHNYAPFGTLLGETTHTSVSSAQVEVQVWQIRMRRQEVSHCELIDMRPGGAMTNLKIYAETELVWK